MAVGSFGAYNLHAGIDGIPFVVALMEAGCARRRRVAFGLRACASRASISRSDARGAGASFWALVNSACARLLVGGPITDARGELLSSCSTRRCRSTGGRVDVAVLALVAMNLCAQHAGRTLWVAVRDMDVAAKSSASPDAREAVGVFAVSLIYCGVAGSAVPFTYSAPSTGMLQPRLSLRISHDLIGGSARSWGPSWRGLHRAAAILPERHDARAESRLDFGRLASHLELIIFGGVIISSDVERTASAVWQIAREAAAVAFRTEHQTRCPRRADTAGECSTLNKEEGT